MKSDGVNRSNIFGITKDNHYNAVCLVMRRAAFRSSQPIAPPPFICVFCLISFCHLCLRLMTCSGSRCVQQLWREEVECIPSPLTLRAEADLRVSVCAHACSSINEYFVSERRGSSSWWSALCWPPLASRLLACGCTHYLTDLWPMNNVQEWLSSHGK